LDLTTWSLRPYQQQAVDGFWDGGSGVVVLPCGAGKTLVGAGAMAAASATTLILVTNTVAARQWKDELLRRTTLTEDEIGEYSGQRKEIRPVTIATYQVLTTKRKGAYTHLDLLDARDWGLIVYDEVHLLPAPIFRMTADLQARRRLGLTATLVREDGREGDVFSLIGPKRYDAPWKDIEAQGYIAPADCIEVRVSLPDGERMAYAMAEPDERYRLASCTDAKDRVVSQLVERHRSEPTLVIGQYLDQLETLAERLDAPIITGETTVLVRQKLYQAFATARSSCSSSARWPTSRSTCPRRRWRSRCPGPSDRVRKRRSVWAGCSGPKATAERRTSTRWSRGTRWTPTSRPTGSGSWRSRGTHTGSSTPTTSPSSEGLSFFQAHVLVTWNGSVPPEPAITCAWKREAGGLEGADPLHEALRRAAVVDGNPAHDVRSPPEEDEHPPVRRGSRLQAAVHDMPAGRTRFQSGRRHLQRLHPLLAQPPRLGLTVVVRVQAAGHGLERQLRGHSPRLVDGHCPERAAHARPGPPRR
jgi:hypothetical protein